MQPISAMADIKASTKSSWHEFDLTRIRTRPAEGAKQPASAGHPT